jgi:hypothetical protein
MSTRIDDFIDQHREEFDDESPSPEIWSRIQEKMKPARGAGTGKAAPVRALYPRRWMAAAAAAIVLAVSGWLYFTLRPSPDPKDLAKKTDLVKPAASNNLPRPVIADSPSTKEVIAQLPVKRKTETGPVSLPDTKTPVPEDPAAEEMYHYTRLIELKHEELKSLKKDEPLLYKKFASDVNKLDSVYNTLKAQLPLQSNREQVIEAMITNLQLQIGLLNRQLKIIKQIKHSKESAYEKAIQQPI